MQRVVDERTQSVDPPDDCAQVQQESAHEASRHERIDAGTSHVVVEVERWHVAHFETVVVVSVLVALDLSQVAGVGGGNDVDVVVRDVGMRGGCHIVNSGVPIERS